MPSLREEITKTFRRLSKSSKRSEAGSAEALAETMLATDPREGRQFGTYRVVRHLGFGGMGRVYLALDMRLGRHVALKFLDHRLTSDPAMLDRLHQEARNASSLNHPNILTIYDVGEENGDHFIASEYVEGITVREALDRGLLTPELSIEIASQAASALVAAHAAGIVHRDLKATNIMVRPDGLVKVIDFGLAKLTSGRASGPGEPLSSPGAISGTVDYMSPEQARGDVVDYRTDLWSLGIVLYEMLAGRLPFDGETDSHVLVAIYDRSVPPLPAKSANPRGITAVLDRALVKDRGKRYQSARDMLLDLQALGKTQQKISALKRFSLVPEETRTRRLPLLVTGLALMLAFGVWWGPFHGREKVFGPNWLDLGQPQQVTFNGRVKLAAIAPDGAHLAYTVRESGKEILHVRDLKTTAESQVPAFIDNSVGLTFSPDSKSIYYVLKDQREWGRLFSVTLSSLVPKLVVDDIDGPVTFSPDGRQFAFMRRSDEKRTSRESIVVAQAGDVGDQRLIVTKANTQIGTLAWSPDGAQIAAVLYNAQLNKSLLPTIFVFTPGGKQQAQYSNPPLRTINNPVWLGSGSLIAFVGVPRGGTYQQAGLYEVSLATGQFRQVASTTIAFDTVSATQRADTLAAVRLAHTASLWLADEKHLDQPSQVPVTGQALDSPAWSNAGDLLYSAATGGNSKLSMINAAGKIKQLALAGDCVAQQLTTIPKSSRAVYSSNCAGGGDFNLWDIDLETGTRRQLTSGSNHDLRPEPTPDGKWIVYTSFPSASPSLLKIPIGGGTPLPISNLQAGNGVVSPDGKRIVCQIREHYDGLWRVAILSLNSGAIEREFPDLPAAPDSIRDGRTNPVRWSPDGGSLDYVDTLNGVSNLWRQPLPGGTPRQLTHFSDLEILAFRWNADGTKLALVRGRAEQDVVFFRPANRH